MYNMLSRTFTSLFIISRISAYQGLRIAEARKDSKQHLHHMTLGQRLCPTQRSFCPHQNTSAFLDFSKINNPQVRRDRPNTEIHHLCTRVVLPISIYLSTYSGMGMVKNIFLTKEQIKDKRYKGTLTVTIRRSEKSQSQKHAEQARVVSSGHLQT